MSTETIIVYAKTSLEEQDYTDNDLRKLYHDFATEERRLQSKPLIDVFIENALQNGITATPDKSEADNFYLWYFFTYILPVNIHLPPTGTKARKRHLEIRSNRFVAMIEDEAFDCIGIIAYRPYQSLYPEQIQKCILKATKAVNLEITSLTYNPTSNHTEFTVKLEHPAGNKTKATYYAYYTPLY